MVQPPTSRQRSTPLDSNSGKPTWRGSTPGSRPAALRLGEADGTVHIDDLSRGGLEALVRGARFAGGRPGQAHEAVRVPEVASRSNKGLRRVCESKPPMSSAGSPERAGCGAPTSPASSSCFSSSSPSRPTPVVLVEYVAGTEYSVEADERDRCRAESGPELREVRRWVAVVREGWWCTRGVGGVTLWYSEQYLGCQFLGWSWRPGGWCS